MSRVLADTSAWIEFFRRGKSPVADSVERLIRDEGVLVVGPVTMELLAGISSRGEGQRIERLLGGLPFEDIGRDDWEAAGETARDLRRRGVTVPMSDILIATVARRLDVQVLTTDKHFRELKVRLYPA